MQSRFLIGAASSGSGKTTLTLGLLRAFARRGLAVQPFKTGPDYIDPHYHRLATQTAGASGMAGASGRESINLDPFMASPDHLRELYARFGAGADVCVVEGAMGLFDGFRADEGSGAEVARLLDLPVVLVVDTRSTAYSVVPLLYGFKHFRPGAPEIAGVIFNRVASASHYAFLAEAARDAGVESLGYLPRADDFTAPERHLGLSLENLEAFSPTIDSIADALEEHACLDRLLRLTLRPTTPPPAAKSDPKPAASPSPARGPLKIAVARDEAFNFIYRANLDRLRELGGRLHFFSPLNDDTPPENADLVYLPGGYPELHARRLSENRPMREAIKAYAEAGGRILAECGGMIYLCRSLIPGPATSAGHSSDTPALPMCGVLPLEATMEGMRLRLGYREVRFGEMILRGHEFHYSHIKGEMPSIARQFSARGEEVATPVYRYRNVIAGYTHLYWAESDPMELFRQ